MKHPLFKKADENIEKEQQVRSEKEISILADRQRKIAELNQRLVFIDPIIRELLSALGEEWFGRTVKKIKTGIFSKETVNALQYVVGKYSKKPNNFDYQIIYYVAKDGDWQTGYSENGVYGDNKYKLGFAISFLFSHDFKVWSSFSRRDELYTIPFDNEFQKTLQKAVEDLIEKAYKQGKLTGRPLTLGWYKYGGID